MCKISRKFDGRTILHNDLQMSRDINKLPLFSSYMTLECCYNQNLLHVFGNKLNNYDG